MGRVIGILSGKGGVGKTTLTSNIGTALSSDFNKKVVLVDSNITAPNLDLHFGLYDEFKYTLRDVISGKATLDQAINKHSLTGVKIIQSPLSRGRNINMKKMKRSIKKLSEDHDVVLIDFAPALGDEVTHSLNSIEEAIIVTTPTIPDVASVLKTIKFLRKQKKPILGMVINRVQNKNFELKAEEIMSVCDLPILAVIDEDPKVPHSISKGIPVVLHHKNSKVSNHFRKLSAELIGEVYSGPSLLQKLRNFLGFN